MRLPLGLERRLTQLQSSLHLWVAVSLSAIVALLFLFVEARALRKDRVDLERDLAIAHRELSSRFTEIQEYLKLFGRELERDTVPSQDLHDQIHGFLEHHKELILILWFRSDDRTPWSTPTVRNHDALAFYRDRLASSIEAARKEGRVTVSPLFQSIEGEKSVAWIIPSGRGDEAPFLLALVSVRRLLQEPIPPWVDELYDLSLVDRTGQMVLREPELQKLNDGLWSVSPAITPGLDLAIRLQRYQDRLDWQAFLLVALSLGVVIGVALAIRELNADRKTKLELAERLQQAKELAEAANRAKSNILAHVSHELRTPLTAILGYADLLKQDLPPSAALSGKLHTIERNGRHLLLLINDLLDLSQVEAGLMPLHTEQTHLPDFLTDIQLTFIPTALTRHLTLHVGTDGPVPVHIDTDPLRLKQILSNLLSNALKFTEQGSVSLQVRYVAPSHLHFDVADTGIGIPTAERIFLFQPLPHRLSRPRRQLKGAGLGLALSQQLAKLLGGSLELAESIEGQGSRFRLQLPIHAPPANDASAWITITEWEAPAIRCEEQPGDLPSLRGRHILVIEDSEDNQALLQEYLQRVDAHVTLASSGEEGLAILEHKACDAILLDIQLPGIDGYETCRLIRERQSPPAIILLSAHLSPHELERCRAAGAQLHLPKPSSMASMVAALCAVLQPASPTRIQMPSETGDTLQLRLWQDTALRPIVRTFVQRLPLRLQDMNAAHRAGDWVKLARLAHALRGTAANFGYPSVAQLAEDLERSASSSTPAAECQRLLGRLGQTIDDIGRSLEVDH